MTPPFPNSYWLEPGRILCGEYPRDFDDLKDHEGMGAILGAGARVFIDLTEEGELRPYAPIALANATGLGIDPGELEFHRHPIHDASVPRNRGAMRAILRTIRCARQKGKIVYLHCWGGRGRTGTVAGCALRDLFGLDGNDALILLSERWRACAKSEWSDSPETEEQTGFVQSFNPFRSRKNQIRGALLGAAIGDALGVPVEFEDRETRKQDPVIGMREYGTHHQPAGTWSDDTSMILATMTGLMQADGWSPDAVMEQFRLWLNEKNTPLMAKFSISGERQLMPSSVQSRARPQPIAAAKRNDPMETGRSCESFRWRSPMRTTRP